jgi:hypothetical protein
MNLVARAEEEEPRFWQTGSMSELEGVRVGVHDLIKLKSVREKSSVAACQVRKRPISQAGLLDERLLSLAWNFFIGPF